MNEKREENKAWEIATCSTKDCPHPLHKMSVEEYEAMQIAKAKQVLKR